MGRPKAQPALTLDQIAELASIGCSDEEIAVLARISEATLQRRFDAQLKDGRASLRERLRRKQVTRALGGSDTMLIWLGKQYLDQRDKQDVGSDPAHPFIFDHSGHSAAAAAIAARSSAYRPPSVADESDSDGETVG